MVYYLLKLNVRVDVAHITNVGKHGAPAYADIEILLRRS